MSRTTPLLITLACLGAARPAYAHFKLTTPANWTAQQTDGSPQKTGPCGNEGSPSDAGAVTEYKVGATISIAIDETVFHQGHYRVSLAADQASLPKDPDSNVVPTTPGAQNCASLAINPAPALPLLADGLLVHSTAFRTPQTMQVTLPAGMLCDHCVLQVVEFMAGGHGAPCFYHHCANIKITTNGPAPGTPGTGSGTDAGTDTEVPSSSGGCNVGAQGVAGAAPLFALVTALVLSRRRSQARRGVARSR